MCKPQTTKKKALLMSILLGKFLERSFWFLGVDEAYAKGDEVVCINIQNRRRFAIERS
jgi:hypothetical protein